MPGAAFPFGCAASAGTDMPNRDTIVIGASAGGVQALMALVAELHPNLPAAIFIVLHIPSDAPQAR